MAAKPVGSVQILAQFWEDLDGNVWQNHGGVNGFEKVYMATQVDEIAALKADLSYVDDLEAQLQAEISTKANSADITDDIIIDFGNPNLVGNVYTDITLANKTVQVTYTDENGTHSPWVIFDSSGVGTLPAIPISGNVQSNLSIRGSTGSLNDFASKTEFTDLKVTVEGGNVDFGITDDISTYTVTNTSALTRINKIFSPNEGIITEVTVKCSQAGDLKLNTWEQISEFVYKLTHQATVACAVGINVFETNLPIKTNGVLGFSVIATDQALVSVKSTGFLSVYGASNISIGQTISVTNAGAEWAIKGVLTLSSIDEKIIAVDTELAELEEDVSVLDLVTIKDDDLTLEATTNKASIDYRIDNMLISSNGDKLFVAGWRTYRIPVQVGDVNTFGNFLIDVGGFFAYFDASEIVGASGGLGLISVSTVYGNTTQPTLLPVTTTAPANAVALYFVVKRPTNTDADSEFLTVNEGDTLLPYENPQAPITGIKGHEIKSGDSYDQSLNTTDDVEFAGITTEALEVTGAIPTGTLAAPPIGLQIGDQWADTTTSAVHPIVRIKVS